MTVAAFLAVERCCDGNFHPELVRLMGFALADAFDLGAMQAEDTKIGAFGHAFDTGEVSVAGMSPLGEHQFMGDRHLQFGLVFRLPDDVAMTRPR